MPTKIISSQELTKKNGPTAATPKKVAHVHLLTGSLITGGRRLRLLALACAPPGDPPQHSTGHQAGSCPAPGQYLVVVARCPAGIVGQR